METKSAAIHRKMLMLVSQLPITGSAHKAGVVGAANQPAVAALLDVPSERRRSADLDCGHDTSLGPAEMSAMAATETHQAL